MLVDVFPFYNELDLLRIRLEELAGLVTCFVLVEAAETFSGKPKPLFFDENSAEFSQFPIEHIVIRRFPAGMTDPWQREYHQRHELLTRLKALNIQGSDVVMLSDVDEIPKRSTVKRCLTSIGTEVPSTIYTFEQHASYYYADLRSNDQWIGTRMARYEDIADMQALREAKGVRIRDAGWHLSYIGGVDRVRSKLGAFSHTEFDCPEITNSAHLQACISGGIDPFGRGEIYKPVELDSSFPRSLIVRPDHFESLFRPKSVDNSLKALFQRARNCQGDISEHLDYLCRLASTVSHITELGTRSGHSTSAFLCARPSKLVCYDIARDPAVNMLEEAARAEGVPFDFFHQDDLTIEIEPTDLLFIDTWHVERQMREELRLHGHKARMYIVLHDTETYGDMGDGAGHRGIWPAVSDYLRDHPEWMVLQHFENNNGLTVLCRRSETQTRVREGGLDA